MRKVCLAICLIGGLLFPPTAGAEEQTAATVDTVAQLRDDYIKASLLVVSPASEVYSVCGHLALRLLCPSQKMDYCFTFETSTDTQGLLRFLSGKAKGGFLASLTENYLQAYRQAGRGVTEYQLNLTPTQKLELWKTVDQEILKGFCHRYDYLHTQCTSMCIDLVRRALGERIEYHDQPALFQGSFRDQMLANAKPYPWSAFFWQTLMGAEGDETEPFEQKLSPTQLPVVWQKATVGGTDQHLVSDEGITLVERADEPCEASWMVSPLAVFTLLLIIVVALTLVQLQTRRVSSDTKAAKALHRAGTVLDMLLLAVHTLLSIFLLWFVLGSQNEGTVWNWYLLPFNLLPQLFWMAFPRKRLLTGRCTIAVWLLFILAVPFIPQSDLPHALLVAGMAIRLWGYTTKLSTKKI